MSNAAAIDSEFKAFHEAHPEVYDLFCKYALNLIRAGNTRYSADAILHVMRYNKVIGKGDDGMYKINNNFSSRYARKFIKENPKYYGFFEFRSLR